MTFGFDFLEYGNNTIFVKTSVNIKLSTLSSFLLSLRSSSQSNQNHINSKSNEMREKFYNLGNKPLTDQISYALYYQFFNIKKPISRITAREKALVNSYKTEIRSIQEPNLSKIAQHFRVKFNFWIRPKRNDPELLESTSEYATTIDLLVTNFSDASVRNTDLKVTELSKIDNLRLGFIPDLELLTGKFIKKSIFHLLGLKLNRDPRELIQKWTQTEYGSEGKIKWVHEKHFINLFSVGFTIISKNLVNKNQNVKRLYQSKCEDYILLESRSSFHQKNFIDTRKDFFNMTSGDFIHECPNEKCSFFTLKNSKLQTHVDSCKPGCKITYKQKDMCEDSIREFLVKEKFLPQDLFVNYAVFYDIESLSVNDPSSGPKSKKSQTQVLGTQRVVTISATANFGPEPRTVNFARKSFSKEDYQELLSDFTNHLKKLHMELSVNLPSVITDSIEKIRDILDQDKASLETTGKSILSVARKSKFQQSYSYLRTFLKLRVLGYNSERYDLCLLLPGLIELWGPENIEVIKRGNGFMMLDTDLFRYLDVLNYLAGGRLADFARSWGAEVEKGLYPYELYKTIEDAKNAVQWPNYKYFNNSLAYKNVPNFIEELELGFKKVSHRVSLTEFSEQFSCPEILDQSPDGVSFPENLVFENLDRRFVTSPIDYCEAWEQFEFLISCDQIHNMFDFLQYYNDNDSKILSVAFGNYTKCFWETFRINPMEFFSLSQMSESIMYKEFDKSVNRPYSLSNGELNRLIRESNCGGATIVFGRHAIANPDMIDIISYDKTVWSLKNGQIIRKIVGFDFNSLYGAAMRLELPTGTGFMYTKESNGFRWSSMKPPGSHGFSLEGVEWINFMQTQYPFTEPDGTVHIIRHAMNGPEEEIRFSDQKVAKYSDGMAIFPDGYVEISGEKYFLFYDGCRWHNCNTCDTKCLNHERYDERRSLLSKLGKVITIKGCEWKIQRKNVKFQCKTSHFFRRKTLIQESELLIAIEKGDLFGLVLCDVVSPPSVIEKWTKINFGPVIRHCEVTEDMIPEIILQNLKKKGVKLPVEKTLTVCFHGTQILLTTTMAQFFINQGMIISNIGMVVEFEKAFPLKGFVNKATAERVKATRNKDSQKAELYKRVVNASYGRSGMRTDNRVKVKYQRHTRIIRSEFEKSRTPLRGEFETDLYEIQSERCTIQDKIPVHLNFFILANSKLIILRCLSDLVDTLDTDKIRLQYMDTDSLARFLRTDKFCLNIVSVAKFSKPCLSIQSHRGVNR